MLLNCGVGEDSWETLGQQRDQTGQSLRKSVLNIHWKDWCWLQYFGHLVRRTLIGKNPDAGKEWRQEEKGTAEDKIVGWYHQLNGQEFEQAVGVGDEREAWCATVHGVTEHRIWLTELNWSFSYHIFCVLCHRLIDHVSMGLFLGSLFFSLDFCFCFCGIPYCIGASLVAQKVKRLLAMWETWIRSLSREDPLEKEMATYSSTLAWRIPWTEKPGRLQSMGSQRVGHDWVTSLHFVLSWLLQLCSRVWSVMLPVVFFPKIALAIWVHLWFHTIFKIICSSSVKNAMGILVGSSLNMQITLGSIFNNIVYVLSHFSHVQLFAILWTIVCQASLSLEFSRQE